jgi:signal transduction histidine kinase
LIKRFVDKLGSDLGAIWLLDEHLGTLVPKATFSGGTADFSEFVIDVGQAWDGVITSSHCLAVEDTSRCVAVEGVGGSPELREMLQKTMPERGLGAILAMPLSVQGKFFGVVAVFWTQPRQFDTRLIRLLEVTADRAATAIEARRLSEGLQLSNEELRRSNEELRQTTEELAKANRSKSEFFNTISHDLRSPLDAIAGYTSLMLRERYGDITPKQTHALHRIEENAKHLLLMVNGILDLARIEAGRMPVHYEQVELEVLLYETVAAVEPLVKEPQIGLDVSIGHDIPVIWTDRGKLKQILVNLLDNAAKFTEEGTIEISATRVSDNGSVEIAVKDTGVGIREEELESVFEAYSQADNIVTRDRVGTGLGLSICKKFAALLGGDIAVQSVYGQGSTFTLSIPCAPPMNTPPDPDAFSESGGIV